jgi:hypothetical protein
MYNSRYRSLTLAAMSIFSYLGGIFTLFTCSSHLPTIVIDTAGYPLSYPVFSWLGGATVISYTHYPFVSTLDYQV